MNEKIINRLFTYLKQKDTPHTRFEKEIGLSNGYLRVQEKRNADLGESVICKIIDNCLDMNIIWLLTGRGSMLNENIAPQTTESTFAPSDAVALRLMDKLDEKDTLLKEKDAENKQLQTELRLMEKELTTFKALHSEYESQSDKITLAFPSDSLEGSIQDSLPMRKPATSSGKSSAGKM